MTIDRMSVRPRSRREFIYGGLAFGGLALVGCSPSSDERAATDPKGGSAGGAPATVQKAAMTVYRDPSCGCCEAWAKIAEDAGYQVTLLDDNNMTAVKQRLGVPAELASCHTAVVGDYVIEGHVPLEEVDRLLRERPSDIKGIAVPGMPLGSPGMEVPDGTKEPFQVIAFDATGRTSIYKA
ncbi:DUF411 domain-containing protein [Sphingosinicella humi]|nr:DUF411 domain-containing protein [Sphingosinicella humi]